jgi:predicted enzyme related to lactoylglutathione lyase
MPNPFAHVELNTKDLKAAKKFYTSVFDWKLLDVPSYTMIEVGKGVGGGMAKAQKGAPTAWLPYVEVADVKKTIATAKKAGAQITLPYMSLGDMGEIGVFVDPTGAALGVWAPGKPVPKAKAKASKKPAKKAAKKKASKK